MIQKNTIIKENINKAIPERTRVRLALSGSSTHTVAVAKQGSPLFNKQQGSKILNQVQDDLVLLTTTDLGFTLIELLVVVLIIGILAAVALPQYQFAIDKSRVSSYLPKIADMVKAQQTYQLANGDYTAQFENLDIDFTKMCSYMNGANELADCPMYTSFAIFRSNKTIALDYCSSKPCAYSYPTNTLLRATFSMQTGKLTACNDFSTARGKKLCAWLTDQFQ